MKVLQLINGLGPGGAQKLTVELCNELSKRHDVSLCSFKPITEDMAFPKKLFSSIAVSSFNKKPGFNLVLFLSVYRLIRRERPDVVHIQAPSIIKYILPSMVLFSKIRFVYTLHNDIYSGNKRFPQLLNRFGFLRGKVFCVCISEVLMERFGTRYSNMNFYLVENGIERLNQGDRHDDVLEELNNLKKDANTKISISIGNLSKPAKNYGLLIDAFRNLKDENVIAIVIGDLKTDDPILLDFINNNEERQNVFFIGFRDNISDYLMASDFLTLSSTREGLPIVVLEALSLGLPIVSTPAGGMVDVLSSPDNGFLTNGFTVKELSGKLKECISLSNGAYLSMKDENLRYFNSNYSMKSCAKKYMDVYNLER